MQYLAGEGEWVNGWRFELCVVVSLALAESVNLCCGANRKIDFDFVRRSPRRCPMLKRAASTVFHH